jgi:hypothetical protein
VATKRAARFSGVQIVQERWAASELWLGGMFTFSAPEYAQTIFSWGTSFAGRCFRKGVQTTPALHSENCFCLPAECVPTAAMTLVCCYAGVPRGAVRELSNSVRRVFCGGRPTVLRTSYCTAGFIRCVQGHVRWWLSGEFRSLTAHAILVFGRQYAPLCTW